MPSIDPQYGPSPCAAPTQYHVIDEERCTTGRSQYERQSLTDKRFPFLDRRVIYILCNSTS